MATTAPGQPASNRDPHAAPVVAAVPVPVIDGSSTILGSGFASSSSRMIPSYPL